MLGSHMFPGGTHPKEGVNGKEATASMPITVLDAPSRVVIPLSQHIGAPAKCIVKKGDYVKMGQVIGEAGGFVSAAIHASVSGTVVSVTECLLANGLQSEAVVIDNDFKDDMVLLPIPNDPEKLTKEELTRYVRDAGIVGLGGATFPTAVKLSPPADQKIDILIINGAECEPYLSADHRLMLENAQSVIDGIGIVMKALQIPKAVIGIEENKKDAAQALRDAIKTDLITVTELPVHYPQGGEKQLIYALTKKRVPNGALPLSVGIIVCNVGTVAAISQALRHGRALVDRVVTVGGMVAKPNNFLVRIGTSVEELLDAAGGIQKGTRQLIYGGPMMGMSISRTDIPVTKGCSGILALEQKSRESEESACIRCGRCVRGCPMQLVPTLIDQYMRVDDYDNAKRVGGLNCIECGVCTYVCPAKRSLTQSCRTVKKVIADRARREKAQQAQSGKEA